MVLVAMATVARAAMVTVVPAVMATMARVVKAVPVVAAMAKAVVVADNCKTTFASHVRVSTIGHPFFLPACPRFFVPRSTNKQICQSSLVCALSLLPHCLVLFFASGSEVRVEPERTQSEPRAKAEWRHGVLSGVKKCGVIFLGAYYSYTKKCQN